MKVEPGRAEDMPALRRVAREQRTTAGFPGRSLLHNLGEFIERRWLGVAVEGGEWLLGFVLIRPGERWTKLYWIAVASSARRHGIGTALLDYAWAHTEHDEIRITVEAENAAAVAFWSRNGFEEYGRQARGQADELLMLGRRTRRRWG